MLRFLVTGFGAFPGASHNPSAALIAALERRRARLARLGIALEVRLLPVVYAGLAARLGRLSCEIRPAAILHFGLAGRRKAISVEIFARSRLNALRPDASGALPGAAALSGPASLRTRIPAPEIVAALRQRRIAGALSRDAGDYVCNATFYHSLSAAEAGADAVGFIHIPAPRRRRLPPLQARGTRPRPSQSRSALAMRRPRFADIVTAAEIAVILTARAARQAAKPVS